MENHKYTSSSMLTGGMRCYTNFTPSGETFATDVHAALGGKGEYPCPADMLAACLASCMLSMIAFTGSRKDFATDGICIKSSCSETPDGISDFNLDIIVPIVLTHAQRSILEHVVLTCPVGKALNPAIRKNITWHWSD
ncbi:MAG: OsmC family protein [Akkermansia sp.]|nr:OsmC family protein [Akkermansia sp.]